MRSPLRAALDSQGYRFEDGYLTTSEMAEAVGVSVTTIKAWRRAGHVVPSIRVPMATTTISIYEPADVAKAQSFKGTRRTGPQPKAKAA